MTNLEEIELIGYLVIVWSMTHLSASWEKTGRPIYHWGNKYVDLLLITWVNCPVIRES